MRHGCLFMSACSCVSRMLLIMSFTFGSSHAIVQNVCSRSKTDNVGSGMTYFEFFQWGIMKFIG